MKKIIPIILLCFIPVSCGLRYVENPPDWTTEEKTYAAASILATLGDYYTTERALDEPGNSEMYLPLGSDPSDLYLGISMAASQIAIMWIADHFPSTRKWLLGGKASLNTGCAIHNYNLVD